MTAGPGERERPVLGAALVAAGLTVVLLLWFGRAAWGGWWIVDRARMPDTYMIATIYERWAAQVRGGNLPLWFPEFAGGSPVHAAWMYGLFYPPLALFLALPPEAAWTWLAILHVVFAALGMYAFVWDQRRDVAAAASSAVVVALSGFLLGRTLCGHLNLVMPFAWAPWILRETARVARGDRGAAGRLALCASMSLLAGHVQVAFYVGPLAVAFAAFESMKRGTIRAAAPRFAAAAALVVGVAAIQWIPAWELFRLSGHPAQDRAFSNEASASASSLVAQIAPRFHPPAADFGHESLGLAGPLAVGAALLAFRPRDRSRWFWFVVLALALLLAAGFRNGASALLNDLPPFAWARASGRAMILVVLAGAVLAGNLVADWTSALSWKARALVPVAFVVSALAFGVPAPDVVDAAIVRAPWTPTLPPAAKEHRVHVVGERTPYLEREGFRTLRAVCPFDTPGYATLTREPAPAALWWLDMGTRVQPPLTGVPSTAAEAAEIAGRTSIETFDACGPAVFFADARAAVSDDDVVARLAAGVRTLSIDDDAADGVRASSAPHSVGLVARSPSEIQFRVTPADGGWLFVSEKWYPGWTTARGGASSVHRGNAAFVAVRLDPRDDGVVDLAYRPWWLGPAAILSAASLVAALLAATVPRLRSRSP